MEENNIKKCVDFNVNLGQFTDQQEIEKSLEFLDYVSSINVACGVHAGTPLTIKKVMGESRFKNKVVGAQIGLPENVNPLGLSEEEIEAIVLYQLGAISSFAKAYSMAIEHVRPFGLMYRTAAENFEFSLNIAKAIKKFSEWLIYYGAAGENLKKAGEEANLNVANELHLNKVYQTGGVIDFDKEDLKDSGRSLIRLRRLLNLSEIDSEAMEYTKIDFDTIHFDVSAENLLDLAKESNKIITPCPFNYNKALTSGWV